MGLETGLDDGRLACADSIAGFVAAVDGVDEYDLLSSSRCHGWTRLDVVVHMIAGWQEMLMGLVTVVDAAPTVDTASYWPAFAAEFGDGDPVPVLMSQRRRTAAYARPGAACEQLREVAAALSEGVRGMRDLPCRWQGHVFAPGDFLAIWAVENAVHHLDLLVPEPPPSSALRLARATIEALAGEPLPARWDDERAVLVGSGRLPADHELGSLAARLPVLG